MLNSHQMLIVTAGVAYVRSVSACLAVPGGEAAREQFADDIRAAAVAAGAWPLAAEHDHDPAKVAKAWAGLLRAAADAVEKAVAGG
jgi:hypothetical protein